jgi:hypothetical protein
MIALKTAWTFYPDCFQSASSFAEYCMFGASCSCSAGKLLSLPWVMYASLVVSNLPARGCADYYCISYYRTAANDPAGSSCMLRYGNSAMPQPAWTMDKILAPTESEVGNFGYQICGLVKVQPIFPLSNQISRSTCQSNGKRQACHCREYLTRAWRAFVRQSRSEFCDRRTSGSRSKAVTSCEVLGWTDYRSAFTTLRFF